MGNNFVQIIVIYEVLDYLYGSKQLLVGVLGDLKNIKPCKVAEFVEKV